MKKVFAMVLVFACAGSAFAQVALQQAGGITGDKAVQAAQADLPAVSAPEDAMPVVTSPEADMPAVSRSEKNFPSTDFGIPDDCKNMPVLYLQNGVLFANGAPLGHSVTRYQGACNGNVAWTDMYGNIYRNKVQLGRGALSFEVALYTGDVVWKNTYGVIAWNANPLGYGVSYKISDYTGAVAWVNNYGVLFRNNLQLGQYNSYHITRHTGDVVWTGNGILFKNNLPLGRHTRFMVADRTGDVAWTDAFLNLYVNNVRVAPSCMQFDLRDDGRLAWRDTYGNYHTR